eukprot:scaffold5075_cov109-Isochrysis_galbana.AAC.12
MPAEALLPFTSVPPQPVYLAFLVSQFPPRAEAAATGPLSPRPSLSSQGDSGGVFPPPAPLRLPPFPCTCARATYSSGRGVEGCVVPPQGLAVYAFV